MGQEIRYVCQKCELESPRWMGRCPRCGAWNSLVQVAPPEGSQPLPGATAHARVLAEAMNVSIESVRGSGPDGFVTEDDVARAVATGNVGREPTSALVKSTRTEPVGAAGMGTDFAPQIREQAEALVRVFAEAETLLKWNVGATDRSLKDWLSAVEADYVRALAYSREEHVGTPARVEGDLQQVGPLHCYWATPWNGIAWSSYTAQSDAPVPMLTRAGVLSLEVAFTRIKTPALFPIIGGRNICIKASGTAKAIAVQAVQSVVLRLLATVSPGKLRLLFIDPVGLGQNVAGFMRLTEYMEDLVGGMAWTEPHRIEQQLANLTEHMETVIQKYLQDQYKTMEEYNAKAGEVAEAYRVVVAINFPANFSEAAARRLVSIATNGPRCGVYVILTVDTDQELPYGFSLQDLERSATVIVHDGNRFVWQDDDYRDVHLEFDAPPPVGVFEHICKQVGPAAREASRVLDPFDRVAPPPEQWWTGKTAKEISVPIGRAGARRILNYSVGHGMAQHGLVAGRTASGKSTLFHVLIMGAALKYPPEEIQLYLIDFKKGVEFKDYATWRLPHARAVAIETEREFGLSVLQGLDAEWRRRAELLRNTSSQDSAEYRQRTGALMPRILLVVDEFQEFFTEDDALASQAALLLDRLARQGRACGIHLLLGSQTLAGAFSLARSTMDQMAVRIALQSSDADSRLILSDDNPAARLLSRPGEAIYNPQGGAPEGNDPFQVAWQSDEQRECLLERLKERAEASGRQFDAPIVFEGNLPSRLEENRFLRDILAASTWPERPRSVQAWLGEPVAIKPPTAARFRRQGGSNLLVVGRDEEVAIGILSGAIVSLASQHRTEDVKFFVVDLTTADAPWSDLAENISQVLPHPIQVVRRRGMVEVIAEVAEVVERRLQGEDLSGPSVYLIILGLQRARDLRPDEARVEETTAQSPARLFPMIVKEGPELGVHVLVWCDTYTNVTKTLERWNLAEFGMRVGLVMSAEDSSQLLDEPTASKLVPYRALFYDEEQVGRLEKFRPYAVPAVEWLQDVGHRLRTRG